MIKNVTCYDEHAIRSFNNISKKSLRFVFISLAILIILFSYFVFQYDLSTAIIISVSTLLFLVLMYMLAVKTINKNIETSIKVNKNTIVNFEFFQDDFSYNSKGDSSESKGNYKYSDLFKVLEIKDFLLLFRTPAEAYIVYINGFEEKFHIEELKHRLMLANKKIKKV